MAATAFSNLVQQTRRQLGDWPDYDALTAAFTDTTGTTMTVADTTIYAKRWPVEVDQETMLIRSITNATTMVVERGAYGSTAATHASAAPVLIRPGFYSVSILDALNEALYATWPLIYQSIVDTSLSTDGTSYEYTIPNISGSTFRGRSIRIPRIWKIEILQAGDTAYREIRRWELVRGTTPTIKFRGIEPSGGTIRIRGYAPFPDATTVASTIDAAFPPEAEYILPIYAAASLLLSGEARRVRIDAGAVDQREQANRVGSSAAIGNQMMQRFYRELRGSARPPMGKHVKVVM